MKAIVYTEYGPPDVLHLQDVSTPVPRDNEILIRVYAAPVHFGDIMARNFATIPPSKFTMPSALWLPARFAFGWSKPRKNILGSELAGEVEAVGKDVTRFSVGDQVFGYRGASMGCYAEYVCMQEMGVVAPKPANMTYEEASAVPYGAIVARNLLRKASIRNGQKVLVNGASGAIGSAAVQLAKYYGAEVTGVCSTPGLAYVKALGANRVIDYTKEDFTASGEAYDLIFDVLGKSSFERCKKSLKPKGVYLLASFKTGQLLQMLRTSVRGDQKVVCALSSEKTEDLVFAKELIEAGKLISIVDRYFPLEQAAEAHRYVESGLKQGNVVLTVG